jgi:hypothetical protein
MKLGSAVVTVALSSSFALSACGSEEKSSVASEQEASPAEAVTEIGQVRSGLDRAVGALRSGDAGQAEEIVSETYVEHFEKVEGPLEKVDHALKERLEEGISGELRQEIREHKPYAQVKRHVDQIKADLNTAETKLK